MSGKYTLYDIFFLFSMGDNKFKRSFDYKEMIRKSIFWVFDLIWFMPKPFDKDNCFLVMESNSRQWKPNLFFCLSKNILKEKQRPCLHVPLIHRYPCKTILLIHMKIRRTYVTSPASFRNICPSARKTWTFKRIFESWENDE